MSAGPAGDERPELERWRAEQRLAVVAGAVPVEGRFEADGPDVKGLSGADHGGCSGRTAAERLQPLSTHIGDLDALDPCRPLRDERVVEPSERFELLAFLDRGVDDRDQVEVALAGVETAGSERPEQVQAEEIRAEMALERLRQLFERVARSRHVGAVHRAVLPSTRSHL